jgi:lactate permease
MAAPIIALSGVTGIDVHLLSQMAGRQTPFLAVFVPLILVFIVDGVRGVRQTWPVAVVAGIAFAASQFVTANFIAVEITDVVASVVTGVAPVGGELQPATASTPAAMVPARIVQRRVTVEAVEWF